MSAAPWLAGVLCTFWFSMLGVWKILGHRIICRCGVTNPYPVGWGISWTLCYTGWKVGLSGEEPIRGLGVLLCWLWHSCLRLLDSIPLLFLSRAWNADALLFTLGWDQYGLHKNRVGTCYAKLVLLHLVRSACHVVYSSAFEARNVDVPFFILGWPRYGFHKKRAWTHYA
jgi:hypothetical protein